MRSDISYGYEIIFILFLKYNGSFFLQLSIEVNPLFNDLNRSWIEKGLELGVKVSRK